MLEKSFGMTLILINIMSLPVYAMGSSKISIFGEVFKLIFYIALFLAVMLFTYYGTKFIAGNLHKINKSRYVDVLDRIKISENLEITLIEVNEDIYVIASGSGNGNVTQIDKIAKDDFNYDKTNLDNEFGSQDNKMLEYINKLLGKEENNE